MGKEKYVDHFLTRAGVIAVTDILKGIEGDFKAYSNDYIPLLHKILIDEDVKKDVKLNVITLLGDICFKITKDFVLHLNFTMEVLIAACSLALMKSDDDSDFENYLQSLRLALVETFTLIFYGLEDCGEIRLFGPYTNSIIGYCNSLVMDDQYILQPEILKGILGFIMDLINIINKNIKTIVNSEMLEKLIVKTKNCGVSKYIEYAKESEEVSYFFI